MSIEILIDGYNLIHSWKFLKNKFKANIEDARDYLIDILASYRKIKKHKVTIVFDAYNTYNYFKSNFPKKGINIVFTAMGETADDFIKKAVSHNGEKFIVVTSDVSIQNYADSYGATFISSEDFIDKLEFTFYFQIKGGFEEDEFEKPSGISTKKKGNPKKLSKKLRKKLKKINKL